MAEHSPSQGKKTEKKPQPAQAQQNTYEQGTERSGILPMDPTLLHNDRLPLASRQEMAQKLGQVHGNQVLQRYLNKNSGSHSNGSAVPDVQRGLFDFATATLDQIFGTVVSTNVLAASRITIPGSWWDVVREYALANPSDAGTIFLALGRGPSYHRGGWVMDLQPDAAAMTLDHDIFVSGKLGMDTFVHELAHVAQYAILGPTTFLASYFGTSAATIAWRFMNREPLEVMRSSPHEEQGYQLEERFREWHESEKGKDPGEIKV